MIITVTVLITATAYSVLLYAVEHDRANRLAVALARAEMRADVAVDAAAKARQAHKAERRWWGAP